MTTIIKFRFPGLWNSEYPLVVNRLIDITGAHDPQALRLQRSFDRLFMQRNQRQAETERVDIRAIRVECDKAIGNLWNAIEFCISEYGETEYLPLVNAINTLNAYYKQQLAARSTRRKAKKDVSKEEKIGMIQ